VVSWDKDPKVFISKALSPSEPVHVELSPDDLTATVVVPDRQLSLAIGKEGQNTRLAARLTGWRLDIKGHTEWEELREERLKEEQELAAAIALEEKDVPAVVAEAEAVAAQAEEAAAELELAEATTVANDELETQVEPAVDVVEESVAEAPEAADDGIPAEATEELDEEQILEALIIEDEQAQETAAEVPQVADAGFSVEDLESFTLGASELLDDEDDEDAEDERELAIEDVDLVPSLSVVIPDAGKIRFAEDIVEESRGGTRGNRKGRRSGASSRGPKKGGR
jgi:hypothetical protein